MRSFTDSLNAIPDYSGQVLIGTVVDNVDPQGIGRVKCTVPGLYEGPTSTLPWCGVKRVSPFGVGPGFGAYGSPAKNSKVMIELQNGQREYPLVVGYYLHLQDKQDDFASENTWGYVDPSGTKLVVNTDTKEWTWTHSSGKGYSFDESGNLTATTANATINIAGDANVHVTGHTTVDCANSTFTGNLIVEGLFTAEAGMIVEGDNGAGVTCTFTGNVNQVSGYMRSNGVTLHTHEHTNGNDGGNTGGPIPG